VVAATALIQAMTATSDRYALGNLGQGLSAVAGRLEAEDAAATAASVTQAMSKTTDSFALRCLAEALSAAAARLETDDAVKAADTLTRALARTNPSDPLHQSLTQSLAAVLDDGLRLKRVQAIAAAVGSLNDSHGLTTHLMLLRPALERPQRRLTDQRLVDLLKQPLCVGPARRAVLDHLEVHHQRPFADHWDFVRHAEAAGLRLDLTSPPRR
jgi:hypothetical protein